MMKSGLIEGSLLMQKRLQAYLNEHIPITQAMGIQVEAASLEKIILSAPILNNINHKKTVFGGSLHAAATLACWSLLHVNLEKLSDHHFEIVITKSEVDFLAPVDADFQIECSLPEKESWARFIKMLFSKGKARISLSASIHHKGKLCVDYRGTFAAIR